ncbi:MAG: tetratricopeptide repeat protein [Chloroflexi bacterium]|nr:tetratricopeptide repeat protein [Chloroflexota bacterium]
MIFQAEDRTRTKKQQADIAIQMALQGQWEQAVDLNRSILESFPADVDACNRLGKALTELGRYADARDSYMKAIEIDPLNLIARKNLSRLSTLGKSAPKKKSKKAASQKLSPEMFIEERGKTTITELARPDMEVANQLTAADLVKLVRDKKGNVFVETMAGQRFGDVESRLGQRLVKLMDGGNQYVAAISSLHEDGVKLLIRETLQSASQVGKLSFPATVTESVRPYIKGRLARGDEDDSSALDDSDEADDLVAGSDDDSDDSDEGTLKARARGRLPGADGDDENDG